jgi:hypothetical protein
MLTALEEGVKGGIWFSLIDKVYAPANLRSAADKVAKNGGAAGVDHVTVEDFGKRRDEHLRDIHEQLRHGVLRPQMIRRKFIDKPGTQEKRPLGIPTVRDRVVQGALRHVLEPIFEREFAEHSAGPARNPGTSLSGPRCSLLAGEAVPPPHRPRHAASPSSPPAGRRAPSARRSGDGKRESPRHAKVLNISSTATASAPARGARTGCGG